MSYHSGSDCTAVTKHYILSFMFIAKFVFFVFLSAVFYYFGTAFQEDLWKEFILYIIFPLSLFFLNYWFLKLILGTIEYYNYIFIVKEDQIYIVNCSLFLKDDIEIIDSFKVIKVDSYSHGLVANILWYGTIVIELQSREVRSFRFMPNPFKLVKKLQEQRNMILEKRSKKYVTLKEEDIKPLQ